MANEVIESLTSLVVGNIYKIAGIKESGDPLINENYKCPKASNSIYCEFYGSQNLLGYFVLYHTVGSFTLKADNNVNVIDDTIIETNPDRFLYKQVPPTMINSYIQARNDLKDL